MSDFDPFQVPTIHKLCEEVSQGEEATRRCARALPPVHHAHTNTAPPNTPKHPPPSPPESPRMHKINAFDSEAKRSGQDPKEVPDVDKTSLKQSLGT